MNVIALIVGIPIAILALDFLASSGLRRLALRNIARRPGEALLVVAGSMLGTAIITAAFIVGDSFEASIRDIARTELGPVDVLVSSDGLDDRDALEAIAADLQSRDVDGVLVTVSTGAAVATVGDDRRAEPQVVVAEADFEAARTFGGDAGLVGFGSIPAPRSGEVVVGGAIADELQVDTGDQIEIFTFGTSSMLTIVGVTPDAGLGGFRGLWVEPGTVTNLAAEATSGRPPWVNILVSNTGGLYDGAVRSDAVVELLETAAAAAGLADVDVHDSKQSLLEAADAEGESMRQLFVSIGSFSVLVGILLLVNLFVMLAEERKRELGMLRAVGMKRNHLQRAFAMEGALYAIAAAFSGGVVGIGVGWLIGQVTRRIISSSGGLEIIFAVETSSVVMGIAIGLVIALATVLATSTRIARLNVIRALRDLPEPIADRLSRRAIAGSIGGMLVGALAIGSGSAIGVLAGPAIAALSAIPLLRRPLGARLSIIVPAVASLVWGIAFFSVSGSAADGAGIEVFVVQGVILVASSVLLLSTADPVWQRISRAFVGRGKGLATRLALAYPLARKVRTGILLAMFSLIIFTMTFMSTFTEIFGSQARSFADKDRGGFDIYVDSNFANPVSSADLAAVDGVTAVAALDRAFPEFLSRISPEATQWSTTGFGADLLEGGVPQLATRADSYADDHAVFAAALADPSLAIISDYFLQTENGPPGSTIGLGETVTMLHPTSDEVREFTIIGVTDADFVFNGMVVQRDGLHEFLGTNVYAGRHYVALDPGADATDFATRLDGRFLANGVQAEVFVDAVERELAEQQGFFRLMQGYLGLGLLIGVAGLGVVMVRGVRERRRQVGILRAMGFGATTVRRAFLLEAGFIAAQGVLLGVGLGLLTAWQVLSNSNAFGEASLPFAIPWGGLLVIVSVPVAASLLTTMRPASQAARIEPAAALRIAD